MALAGVDEPEHADGATRPARSVRSAGDGAGRPGAHGRGAIGSGMTDVSRSMPICAEAPPLVLAAHDERIRPSGHAEVGVGAATGVGRAGRLGDVVERDDPPTGQPSASARTPPRRRRVGTEEPVGEVQVDDVGVPGPRRDGHRRLGRTDHGHVGRRGDRPHGRTTPWSAGPTTMLHTGQHPPVHRTASVVRRSSVDGSKWTSPRSASSVNQPVIGQWPHRSWNRRALATISPVRRRVETGRSVPLVVGGPPPNQASGMPRDRGPERQVGVLAAVPAVPLVEAAEPIPRVPVHAEAERPEQLVVVAEPHVVAIRDGPGRRCRRCGRPAGASGSPAQPCCR